MTDVQQYINKKSFWHSLNPMVKLIVTLVLIVLVFIPLGFLGQLIVFTLIGIICILAKIPWKTLKSILITWLVMLIILFIINWLCYKSPELVLDVENKRPLIFGTYEDLFKSSKNFEHISLDNYTGWIVHGSLFGGEILQITDIKPTIGSYISSIASNGVQLYLPYVAKWYSLSSEVIFNSFNVSFKILLMITIVTLLVFTTNNIMLTIAIEDLLYPLQYLRIPINELAMTIAIAIRFVPSLLAEAQNILRAQASRGVDFRNGNFKNRLKALICLVIPMFSIAFHKADDLSNSMEARSYNPRIVRTSYRHYGVKFQDVIGILLIGLVFGIYLTLAIKKVIFAPFGWVDIMMLG